MAVMVFIAEAEDRHPRSTVTGPVPRAGFFLILTTKGLAERVENCALICNCIFNAIVH